MSDELAFLAPLALVGAIWFLVPAGAWRRRSVQLAGTAVFLVLFARYLWWRSTVTLSGAGLDPQGLFVWIFAAGELLAWVDAVLLLALLLRRRDRNEEADRHEARLRALDPSALPTVDVFIATYNEGPEVLEKTIVGATRLDWPRDKIRVYVLDDGRRDWVAELARREGAIHLTRPDNRHAKAGNINAALERTGGEFVLVLDADFVPQRNMLWRMIGFFDDPSIGIVQAPHTFFNADPIQASLDLRERMADEQRFFFDDIMRGRDGWGVAFCCGSNGIIRRAALDSIGGKLPTDSITEDMLLTLTLLRRGYRTIYLHEPLAFGLAPESLGAFFVQRARWARGALQIMFLPNGPFGPGLTLAQRIFFLPTHWIGEGISQLVFMAAPAVTLLTSLRPLLGATLEDVVSYQVATLLAIVTLLRRLAPRNYVPAAGTIVAMLRGFRLLPVVLTTLVKPFGHPFKVTPKGADARSEAARDGPTLALSLGLACANLLGLLVASAGDWHGDALDDLIPIVVFWAAVNSILLLVVSVIATTPPSPRREERFPWVEVTRLRASSARIGPDRSAGDREPREGVAGEPCRDRPACEVPRNADARNPVELTVRGLDLSLIGAAVRLVAEGDRSDDGRPPDPAGAAFGPGRTVELWIGEVGWMPGEIVRTWRAEDGSLCLGLAFLPMHHTLRARLIARLFTRGLRSRPASSDALTQTWAMIAAVARARA